MAVPMNTKPTIPTELIERLRREADELDAMTRSLVSMADAAGVAGEYSGRSVKSDSGDTMREAADTIQTLREALERRDTALRNARAWVFECWGWLMETDLDMTCPMQTDPLDIVEQIDAILGIDQALTTRKV